MRSPRSFDDSRLPTLSGRRILVVEDNVHSAALVKTMLLAAGAAQVSVAPDGERALPLLTSFRPDVVVTDMVMPVVGGLELIRAIRQAALTPNPAIPDPTVPIVLLSAFGSRQSVRAARAAGIDAFVVKPFSTGSLVKRVDRAGRRSAPFIIDPGYVGPCRRGKAVGKMGGRRAEDWGVEDRRSARRAPAPATLRLVDPAEEASPEAGPSLLKALYERIRELEDERSVAID